MNSVVLIGRITADPEIRYIPESQMAVCSFSLAVDRIGAKEKTADFPRVTCFGKTAENLERFTEKGKLIAVQGRLQTGSYKNKDGVTVYTTDTIADRIQFLEWKDKDGSAKAKNDADFKQAPDVPEGFQALEDDDDIPF